MKRNLLLLAGMIGAILFFTPHNAGATCAEQSDDLGICDTIYVETFDNDHLYDATGSYDSVRVAIYVTHDSNTLPPESPYAGVQDSITSFVVPLSFSMEGDADSVVFPGSSPWNTGWNNKKMDEGSAQFSRSIFRHLYNPNTGVTDSNRFVLGVNDGWTDWSVSLDVERKAPGHVFIGLLPTSTSQRWQEGSRILFATYTFFVYMHPGGKYAKINFDSTFWAPTSHLTFVRYDASTYCPRHFLPNADSVYTGVKWIEGSAEEENKPTAFLLSQNYPNPFNPVTNFKLSLPHASHVKMEIFNIVGQRVKTLLDEDMRAGVFVVDWDGKDERGVGVSSGVYFYRVVAGNFSDIKKMVLLR
jgi:hypothetical protein